MLSIFIMLLQFMQIFIASNQQRCMAIISIYICCIVSCIWSSQEPAIALADDEFFNYYQQKQSPSSDSLKSSGKQADAKAQEKVMILVL
jgi:hypothetical protein